MLKHQLKLKHGYVITSHCLLFDVITYPYPNIIDGLSKLLLFLVKGPQGEMHSECNDIDRLIDS